MHHKPTARWSWMTPHDPKDHWFIRSLVQFLVPVPQSRRGYASLPGQLLLFEKHTDENLQNHDMKGTNDE